MAMIVHDGPVVTRPGWDGTRCRATSEAGFTLAEMLVVTVIIVLTLGITTTALVQTQRNYSAQRERLETAHQARAAVEIMSRLIRMSGNNPYGIAMTPITTGNTDADPFFDWIRVQADWNPADGDLNDPYEDITFTAAGGNLTKFEPSLVADATLGVPPPDTAPVVFAENVAGLDIAYRDTNDNAIANPVASAVPIAFVTLTLTTQNTQQVQDGAALAVTTSVAVRRNE
jgi:type II secretory pathway pseudopilin PulG